MSRRAHPNGILVLVPSLPVRMSHEEVARRALIRAPADSMPVRVIAVDGHGGAGKSTLAARLAGALGGATVVPTDDFASWDEPIDWWPRLLDQVLRPLAAGTAGRYQRYDWAQRRLGAWIDVPSDRTIVIEGVSSSRVAFRPYLSFAIWVETPRDVCLARGLARDGAHMLPQWEQWMAAEDHYVEREAPDRRADLVVDGAPDIEHDADRDVIVLRDGPRFDQPSG